jgi:hypothetical protein
MAMGNLSLHYFSLDIEGADLANGHVEEPPLGQGGHAGADSGDPSGRTGVPRHKSRYIIGFMDSVRYWLLEIRSLC